MEGPDTNRETNESFFPRETSFPSIEQDGSLFLRGLHVSNSDDAITETRNKLVDLVVQEETCNQITEPEKSVTKYFLDEATERQFLSGCLNGYQNVEEGGNVPSSGIDMESVDYISKIRITWFYTKLYQICLPSHVKVTNDVVLALKDIAKKLILTAFDTQNKGVKADVSAFFHSFGSHVSVGPFAVGGCSIEKMSVSGCKSYDKKVILEKLDNEFNRMEPEDIDISGDTGDSVVVAIHSDKPGEQYIELHREIHLFGGETTANYADWRKSLSSSSQVVSSTRSLQVLVPIWNILSKEEDLLGEAQHRVCQILQQVWVENNGENDSIPELFTLLNFPENVCSLSDVRLLRHNSCENGISIKNVFWQFVRAITSLDHRGRDIKIYNEVADESDDIDKSSASKDIFRQKPSDVNSMDIIYGVLQRCDHFLRQELISKMAECNLAVPILLPGMKITDSVEFQCWGLQKIYKSWRPRNANTTVKKSVVTHPLPMVSFVRFGPLPLSKSKLLNDVMGNLQGTNDHRYFMSKRASSPYAKWSKGTLEVAWFVPEPGRSHHEHALLDAVAFLNLRGDAEHFPRQTEFVCKASDAVVLLVDDNKYEMLSPKITKLSELTQNPLICIIAGGQASEVNTNCKGNLVTITGARDIGEVLCREIHHRLWPKDKLSAGYRSIESLTDLCDDLDIKVDMNLQECLTGKQLAHMFYRSVSESPEAYKEVNLPLQGHLLKQLGMLQMEKMNGYRSTTDQEICKIEFHRATIEKKIRAIREQEMTMEPGKDMLRFIEALNLPRIDRQFFLAWFNIYLNRLYQDNLDELARLRKMPKENQVDDDQPVPDETKHNPTEDGQINLKRAVEEQSDDLEQRIKSKSENYPPAIEDFIRELGQYFEAFEETKGQTDIQRCKNIQPTRFPDLAADILMDGYPLEILDGEAGRIHMRWVQAVLKSVRGKIGNATVSSVAVLGIQSSGKSTLLNALFGTHFAVRGGRCTRGVYIQLLRVGENLRKEIQNDYIIIIDTEGLKGSERSSSDDVKYENILSTFAMCLADLTIINIAGQTVEAGTKDVLEIASHTFIRMSKVKSKSSCRIVQQFVADPSAENENETCIQLFIEKLDEATAAAAKSEGYGDKYASFSDVFNLKRNTAVQYMPSLWYGPMTPPNHRYSEKVISLRKLVISDIATTSTNLDQFSNMMCIVWNALQKEDFILSFQNSVTALHYKAFQLVYGKWIGEMAQCIRKREVEKKTILQNESSTKINQTNGRLKAELKQTIAQESLEIQTKIRRHFKESDDGVNFRKFEREFLRDLELTQRDFENCTYESLDRAVESYKQFNENKVFLSECEKDLLQCARKQTLDSINSGSTIVHTLGVVNVEDTLVKFEDRFSCWKKRIHETKPLTHVLHDDVEREFDSYLFHQERKWGISATKLSHEIEQVCKVGIDERNQSDVIEMIIQNSLSVLKKDIEHDLLFDSRTIQKLIDSTFKSLFKRNNITADEVVTAIVEVRNRGIPMIVNGRNDYYKTHSPQGLLESERDRLRDQFILFCKCSNQDQRASMAFASMVTQISTEIVRGYLGSEISRSARNECQFFDSKFKLFGHILEDIAYKEHFEAYPKFIFDPELFVEEWSLDKIAQLCVRSTKRGDSLCHSLAEEKIKDILKAIEGVAESLDSSDDNIIMVQQWLAKINDALPQFCLGDDEAMKVKEFDIQDISYFTEEVVRHIKHTLKQNIFQKLDLPECENVEKAVNFLQSLQTKPHQELTRHIRTGCMAKCPICRAPCDNLTKEHEKHRAELHYPEGLIGSIAARDNRLLTSICTSSITTDDYYWDGQTKMQYRAYQEYYPDWVIQPIEGAGPSKYWKWVMSRFNRDFAKFYRYEEADLPQGWKDITKEEALSDLREAYAMSYHSQCI